MPELPSGGWSPGAVLDIPGGSPGNGISPWKVREAAPLGLPGPFLPTCESSQSRVTGALVTGVSQRQAGLLLLTPLPPARAQPCAVTAPGAAEGLGDRNAPGGLKGGEQKWDLGTNCCVYNQGSHNHQNLNPELCNNQHLSQIYKFTYI